MEGNPIAAFSLRTTYLRRADVVEKLSCLEDDHSVRSTAKEKPPKHGTEKAEGHRAQPTGNRFTELLIDDPNYSRSWWERVLEVSALLLIRWC